jgi:hypothetical protein
MVKENTLKPRRKKMTPKYDTMCEWEKEKALYLQKIALDLGMRIDGYGELAVNPNSGYTYLWLEDYNFTLYMPISCELKKSDVWALWTNPEDGEEIEISVGRRTLENLEAWASKQDRKYRTA